MFDALNGVIALVEQPSWVYRFWVTVANRYGNTKNGSSIL